MAAWTSFRGDTLAIPVAVKNAATGAATDLTGWLVWFTVKRNYADPDSQSVFQARSDDMSGGVVITEPPTLGQITATLPASATLGWPDSPSNLVYDVQGKDTSGNIRTVDSGTICVTPDVTRSTF